MNAIKEWFTANPRRAYAIGAAVLLLSVLFSCVARSADLPVTWTYPATNTDGSAIPASGPGSISGFVLEWGTCSGTSFGTKIGGAAPTAPATSFTVTGLQPGTYCVRIAAVNTYAIVSAFSNVATKTITAPTPNPPVLTIATIAYELRGYSNGTFRMVNVGSVPLNSACGAKLAQNFYAYPSANITKPTTGGIIAAKCG